MFGFKAPAQHLDVWLAAGPDFRTMRVYWDVSVENYLFSKYVF